MDTARHVLGVLLVVMAPPAVGFWLLIHPLIRFWRRIGPRAAYLATTTLCALLGLLLYRNREALLGTDLGTSWLLVSFGGVLYVASGWLSFLTRRQLKLRIFAGLPELSGDGAGGVLLQEGPYAWVRHPRYLSVFIGITGFSLIANHAGAYLVVLASFIALWGVVGLEERELGRRFGAAYERYRSQVPALIPRLSKAGRPGRRPGANPGSCRCRRQTSRDPDRPIDGRPQRAHGDKDQDPHEKRAGPPPGPVGDRRIQESSEPQ